MLFFIYFILFWTNHLYDITLSIDMIATLGETTGLFSLRRMQKRMTEDPVGQQILE